MSKPRSPSPTTPSTSLVRVVVCVLQALSLPARAAAWPPAWPGWLYHVDRRHRLVADDNLRTPSPASTPTPSATGWCARSTGISAPCSIEIVHTAAPLHPTNWRRYVELADGAAAGRAAAVGPAAAAGDRPLRQLGDGRLRPRPARLPHLRHRPHAGQSVSGRLPAHASASGPGRASSTRTAISSKIQAVLASGGVLATLGDQDAGQRGLFVDFFGRPASTHKAVALLALEHRVPMVVIGVPQRRPSRCAIRSSSRT